MKPEILEILEAISILNTELHRFRNECQHLNIKYKYKSNTGNWCSVDDSYWLDIICKDCGKPIRIDSERDPEGYKLRGIIGSVAKEKQIEN